MSTSDWASAGEAFLNNVAEHLLKPREFKDGDAVLWKGQLYRQVQGEFIRWPELSLGRERLADDPDFIEATKGIPDAHA